MPEIPIVTTAGTVLPSDRLFLPPRVNSAQEVRESLLLRAESVNAGVRKSGIKPGFFVGLKTGCNG
jgi:hypothetical protein